MGKVAADLRKMGIRDEKLKTEDRYIYIGENKREF